MTEPLRSLGLLAVLGDRRSACVVDMDLDTRCCKERYSEAVVARGTEQCFGRSAIKVASCAFQEPCDEPTLADCFPGPRIATSNRQAGL